MGETERERRERERERGREGEMNSAWNIEHYSHNVSLLKAQMYTYVHTV